MKTYTVEINAAQKFQSAEYIEVGTVKANSKKEAKEKAEEYRRSSGNAFADDCNLYGLTGELRPFIVR